MVMFILAHLLKLYTDRRDAYPTLHSIKLNIGENQKFPQMKPVWQIELNRLDRVMKRKRLCVFGFYIHPLLRFEVQLIEAIA
jgi:hypothetical protein